MRSLHTATVAVVEDGNMKLTFLIYVLFIVLSDHEEAANPPWIKLYQPPHIAANNYPLVIILLRKHPQKNHYVVYQRGYLKVVIT